MCCLFELQWVMPKRVIINMFAAWHGALGRYRNIAFWKVVPHCIMWSFWRERNARNFKGYEQTILDLKSFFFCTLLDWSVAFNSRPCFSILDMFEYSNLKNVTSTTLLQHFHNKS